MFTIHFIGFRSGSDKVYGLTSWQRLRDPNQFLCPASLYTDVCCSILSSDGENILFRLLPHSFLNLDIKGSVTTCIHIQAPCCSFIERNLSMPVLCRHTCIYLFIFIYNETVILDLCCVHWKCWEIQWLLLLCRKASIFHLNRFSALT